MDDDGIWPDRDTAWGIEARQLAKVSGWALDQCCDLVIIAYLDTGDDRPLVDLFQHQRVPGAPALKYLAAMFDHSLPRVVACRVASRYEILSALAEGDRPGQSISSLECGIEFSLGK
jgi:hypothetical protein